MNLRDLGEIRADEMREVKPIILMGIVHDLQETFVPGRRATIKDWAGESRGSEDWRLRIADSKATAQGPTPRVSIFHFLSSSFQFPVCGSERVRATSKATMCSRINRLANGRQERAIKDWVGEWTGSENRRLEIADSKARADAGQFPIPSFRGEKELQRAKPRCYSKSILSFRPRRSPHQGLG